MKIEQLSSIDQKRVADALAKCASATKDIEDSEQLQSAAYSIFKEALGDSPGLFKVACRVYNSCKSIHKLSAAGDDDRGNSFAILDANSLTNRLKNDNNIALFKRASVPATFGVLSKAEPTHGHMQKAASAGVDKVSGIVAEKLDGATKRNALNQVISDWEELVKEASAELSESQRTNNRCVADFVYSLSAIPANLCKSAAAEAYANYGGLISEAIDKFNSSKPMYKIASCDYVGKFKGTPVITDKELARSADNLCKSHANLLTKKAYMDRIVVECTAAIKDLFNGIRKSAASDGLAGKALTAAIGADVVSGIPELLGYDYTEDKARSALADTKIENAIIAAGSRRAFMKSLHNDTIASYPLPEIIKAFNMAYSKLPPSVRRMPATRSQALIDAEMITALAEGNTPSKADREHLLSIMKQFDYKTPVGLAEGLVS